MYTSTIIFNTLTILVGIGSIIVNIWMTRYNVGKNRIIYDVEEIMVDKTKSNCFENLNKKLNVGEYTVLNTYQDKGDSQTRIFVLGKIKK